MSEERIEKVRCLLRKYWLPIVKKKKELFSKIHLSLELELSVFYCSLMILMGIVIFLPVGYIIYHSELSAMEFSFHYTGQKWTISIVYIYKAAMLLYVAGIFLIVELSAKNIKRISKKMEDIIKQTNRITIHSLEQDRLNVDGIQNELKDIAQTINSMLDRLELSYETQKQFVSDASHELRTPIAVIQGYVNMLDRWGAEDPEVLEESVQAVKGEAQSMQELVEKLLFLSRHDKKTLKLTKRRFNVTKMVQEILKESMLLASERNVEALDMDSVILYGDRQMLKEALRVLLENAIKYTKPGDSIYIGCEKQEGNCILTVADTGMGMTEKDMDHIFQRFYRSDNVRNGNISGHGLGLSIAKLIILKHVGTIDIKSQYTRGTCFKITLPIQTF